MFGYLKPYVPLLRVKDNELYKAVYCGVCVSLENCFGKSASMTLSYDITFLACVRLLLKGEKFTVRKKRCSFNPTKKCRIAVGGEELNFCASLGILLTYYKLLDTKHDERGMKKFAALVSLPIANVKRKKVVKQYGEEIDLTVKEGLLELSKLEKENRKSIDDPANVFGKMLGKLASFGLSGNEEKIAKKAGEYIGRWIYIADAVDDCSEDAEKGRYNPILAMYGKIPEDECFEMIAATLVPTLENLSAAFDLAERKTEEAEKDEESVCAYFSDELFSILDNTVKYGMPEAFKKILPSSKAHNKRRS